MIFDRRQLKSSVDNNSSSSSSAIVMSTEFDTNSPTTIISITTTRRCNSKLDRDHDTEDDAIKEPGDMNPLETSLFFGGNYNNFQQPNNYVSLPTTNNNNNDDGGYVSPMLSFIDFGKEPETNIYITNNSAAENDDEQVMPDDVAATTSRKAPTSYVNRKSATSFGGNSSKRFKPYQRPVPSPAIMSSPTGPPVPCKNVSIIRNPIRRECGVIERATSTVAGAASVLSQLPNIPLNVGTGGDIWPTCIEHFKISMGICSSFVQRLPGFDGLPIEDRSLLFKASYMPINLSKSSQPNKGDYLAAIASSKAAAAPSDDDVIGFNKDAQAVMVRQFPPFQAIVKQADDVSKAVTDWNPSFLEFALLQGLLYYQNASENKNFARPDLVHKMHRLLSVALKCVSDAKFSSSSELPPLKKANNSSAGKKISKEIALVKSEKKFRNIYSMLKQSAQFFDEMAAALADKQPDLFHMDPLYADILASGGHA